jgi:hypothetical protein
MNKLTMLSVGKRVLRGVVKIVATAAGLVFLFDNRLSGNAGTVLLGSIAVLFVCLFVWLIFGPRRGYWVLAKQAQPASRHRPGEAKRH